MKSPISNPPRTLNPEPHPWGQTNNCKSCRSWQPPQPSTQNPQPVSGYCPTFQNMTQPEDGASCTAWHPLSTPELLSLATRTTRYHAHDGERAILHWADYERLLQLAAGSADINQLGTNNPASESGKHATVRPFHHS